jgi:hypothetical protein
VPIFVIQPIIERTILETVLPDLRYLCSGAQIGGLIHFQKPSTASQLYRLTIPRIWRVVEALGHHFPSGQRLSAKCGWKVVNVERRVILESGGAGHKYE